LSLKFFLFPGIEELRPNNSKKARWLITLSPLSKLAQGATDEIPDRENSTNAFMKADAEGEIKFVKWL
jgi:hypothetical protein